jgi:two-component sensor histidine kinase
VQWHSAADNQIEFLWREKNVVLKTTPVREGFGTTVIKRALPQAKVRHEIGADGLVCQIHFNL